MIYGKKSWLIRVSSKKLIKEWKKRNKWKVRSFIVFLSISDQYREGVIEGDQIGVAAFTLESFAYLTELVTANNNAGINSARACQLIQIEPCFIPIGYMWSGAITASVIIGYYQPSRICKKLKRKSSCFNLVTSIITYTGSHFQWIVRKMTKKVYNMCSWDKDCENIIVYRLTACNGISVLKIFWFAKK